MMKLEAYDKALPYSYALGVFPCLELLDARPQAVRRLLLHPDAARGEGYAKLTARCQQLGVRIEYAEKALARISRKENCYAALVFDKYQDALDPAGAHIMLHHIADGGNLGTILRAALGFGYQDVAIIRPAVDFFEPHTLRASMGAAFRLRVAVYDDFTQYGASGRALYPFMLTAALPLEEAAAQAPGLHTLIFGNEGAGLPEEFARIGQSVIIPHSAQIDSLNLAVAASIGMYAFSRRARP